MLKSILTCLGSLAWMVGLMGCAGDPYVASTSHPIDGSPPVAGGYSQNSGQGIEDRRTAERVREALAAVADYRYGGVRVSESQGVVQLNGFVKTSAQKNGAGEVAYKVAGVKVVENNLTVKD
jgi:osmotically-inducible protein OsmY